MAEVSAVVPAAGSSSRMQGPNKLLLPFGKSTVVGTVVQTLLSCGLEVVVVAGRDSEDVSKAVLPARTVLNPEYEKGLGTSIACGAKQVQKGSAILIALGDMPGIDSATVLRVLETYESDPEDTIIVPVTAVNPVRSGHPVLFAPVYQTELAALERDVGAKHLLHRYSDRIRHVLVERQAEDIDSPEDYARLIASSEEQS